MNMGEFQEIADRLAAAKDDTLEFPEPWHVDARAGLTKILEGETVIARVCRRPSTFGDATLMAAAPTMHAMLRKFLETGLDSDRLSALATAADNFLNDLETRT